RVTQVAAPEGTLNYAYDPATGRHTRTWTANSDIGYGYDQLGRLQTVTLTKRDGLTLATPEVTTYRYNAVGLVDLVTHPTGMKTENSYGPVDRLAAVTHKTASDAVFARYVYTRDADGRITDVAESDAGGPTGTTHYDYDALGRLTQESYN